MTKPPCYIGYATDDDVRYKSASGGITTAIISYLFLTGQIQTVLACHFNVDECKYEPKFVYSFDEYEMVGSVYQDMDVIGYIRDNLTIAKGRILVVCAPCQVKAIRSILNRANIDCIIIDYFCSGQTTIEGTYCYYRFLGINKGDVANIRYRGNGWPNGIEITLKGGEVIKKPNYTEPWSTIHQSGLFKPKRCHYCKLAESADADISVGDPWLKRFETERIGQTMFLVHTQNGQEIVARMICDGTIMAEQVAYSSFLISQKPNLEKPGFVKNNKRFIDLSLRLTYNPYYKKLATKTLMRMKLHNRLMLRFSQMHRALSQGFIFSCSSFAKKMLNKIKTGGGKLVFEEEIRWTG